MIPTYHSLESLSIRSQDELLAAFSQIAANVPPAKLAHNPDDMP